VSKRIAHTGGVGAIKHIRRRLDLRRARLDGTSQEGFVVIDEDVQAGGAAADGVRLAIQPVVWIANHHERTADFELGVEDLAVGMSDPKQLNRAKRLLLEGYPVRCSIDINVGNDCVPIPLGSYSHLPCSCMNLALLLL
jgi:hypothetical protein